LHGEKARARDGIHFLVIAGLDPAIHSNCQHILIFIMDARAGKLAQPA
jgi:hypothetical protein